MRTRTKEEALKEIENVKQNIEEVKAERREAFRAGRTDVVKELSSDIYEQMKQINQSLWDYEVSCEEIYYKITKA